jgi:hypothetical protein
MITHQRVLGGRNITADQMECAGRAGLLHQMLKDRFASRSVNAGDGSRPALFYWPCQRGGRFSAKARGPST